GQPPAGRAADAAAVGVVLGAGLGVLSEESGRHEAGREVTVVLDPLDGSTNASRGIPWYAASVCAVDAYRPLAARRRAARTPSSTAVPRPTAPGITWAGCWCAARRAPWRTMLAVGTWSWST